ncbi:uncharacterized protein LOC123195469 isoform X3 [Mangifera indica]|nr:uncharacterized protein LOC123195469 isoform X3 [Mangifera indica]
MSKRNCGNVRGEDSTDGSGSGASSSFSNSIGAELSDFKMERLKSLLREGVFDLSPEVDEMLDPVIAMCQLQSQIRNRKSASKGHAVEVPFKKHKRSSSFSSTSIPGHPNPLNSGSCKEVDDDLQFLLENNSLQVEQMTKKYSDELLETLGHMEKQLEELLNAVVSKCRPMTLSEKQELWKMIQKLPPNNLDRVVEIVQHDKSAEPLSSDEYFIDLEKEVKSQKHDINCEYIELLILCKISSFRIM